MIGRNQQSDLVNGCFTGRRLFVRAVIRTYVTFLFRWRPIPVKTICWRLRGFVRQSDIFEMLQGTDDAAMVVDERGLICFWNGSAERLLGFSADDARQKECWALLDGCDLSDTRVCTADCRVVEISRYNCRI